MDTSKSARITFRATPMLNDRIDNYAKLAGISKNQVIEEAVDFYLSVKTGLYDFNEPALQRLSQLQDAQVGTTQEVRDLNKSIEGLAEVLMRYVNGNNFLGE